ncbi:MAG: hypothetical protein OXK79_04985 [Chloroflexota bacterium]|nr:hypothetical protein [Chloroflexota bacterium]
MRSHPITYNRRLHITRAALFIVALAVLLLVMAEAETANADSDRAALVALCNATDGPNWTNNTNWLSGREGS